MLLVDVLVELTSQCSPRWWCSYWCRCSMHLCRCCCQRRCRQTIFVSELLVEQFNVDHVVINDFLPVVLLDVEHDVGAELCKFHPLDVRFCCWARRCPYFCCKLFVEHFSLLLSLVFCHRFAWFDEVVVLLSVTDPILCCQVLLFRPLLSIPLMRTHAQLLVVLHFDVVGDVVPPRWPVASVGATRGLVGSWSDRPDSDVATQLCCCPLSGLPRGHRDVVLWLW